jgi:HSP20 family protein
MNVLARWNPFNPYVEDEIGRFQNEVSQLFNRFRFPFRARLPLAISYPPVNVWEDGEFLYAEAELPGLNLGDLEIFVTGEEQLTIKGTRPPLVLEKVEWHRQERAFGAFSRVIPLPFPVIPTKVEAHLENGVLTIKMAKSPAIMPKKIPVKAV